jgi:hypothetical protein
MEDGVSGTVAGFSVELDERMVVVVELIKTLVGWTSADDELSELLDNCFELDTRLLGGANVGESLDVGWILSELLDK